MSAGSFTDVSVVLPPPTVEAVGPRIRVAYPSRAVSSRNEAIDVVRLFAAAGIVFVHAGESPAFDRWGNFFRFGVPFFLFASLFYQSSSLRRNPNRTLTSFIANRLTRLYLPFVIWSAIYLIVRNCNRVFLQHEGLVMPRPAMLWTGTEYHLWFLPLLLMCSVVLAVLQRALFRHNPSLRWPAIGIAIGLGLAVANGPMPQMPSVTEASFDSPTYAYLQWWLALPAASWALAFAWAMTLGPVLYSIPQVVGIAGVLLATWCSVKQAVHGLELGPRGLSGLGCMIAALSPWNGRLVSVLARYGRMGYGIYLCHVIPVEVIHIISHRLRLPASGYLDVLTFELSFTISFGVVWLISRSPKLEWLVG